MRVAILTLGVSFVLAPGTALPSEVREELPFVRLGPEHGLSHNSVYAVLQDTQGFMWFGTQDGLDRWDGYEFRSWKHDRDDLSSLGSSWVRALLEDETGALWIGTDRGLGRLSPDRTRLERIRLPKGFSGVVSVKALGLSADGGIWVGTDRGLFRYQPGAGELLLAPIESLRVPISHVEESADGAVWMLTQVESDGALLRFDPTRGGVSRYPLSSPAHTFRLLGGRAIWIGCSEPSLAVDEAPRPVANLVDKTGAPRALAVAGDGTLWSGNLHGLTAMAKDGSVRRLRTDVAAGARLANEIRSLHVDRTGTVWAGTHGGVFRYDPNRKPMRHLTHVPGNPESLGSAAVSSIVEDAAGVLWIGTFGGGISRIDRVTGQVTTLRARPVEPASLCGDSIWALSIDDGRRLWAVGEGGICSVDTGSGAVDSAWLDKPESAVFAMAWRGDGEAWLGGYNAIYLIDLRTGNWQRSPFGAPELTDTQVIRKLDQTYWFGTGSGTLAGFNESTAEWIVLEGLADGPITDVEAKGRDELWLATGGGLASLDLESSRLTRVRPDPAWPGSVVYTVTSDRGGDLWLGTNKGLGRYSSGAAEGAHFVHYDLSDGIGNLEFNRKAKLRTRDGTMILGGMDGLTIFQPEAIRPNPHPPRVVLTDLTVLGSRGERRLRAFPLDRLVLQASDVSVSFEFSALSFTSPEKNRYAHRLEGLDLDWVEAGTRRFARYTSIPPGEYTFRVKASNNDGVWSETGLFLPVTVLPPFWQTWWFRLLVVAAIATLLASWHRLRVGRLLAMERMRLRIASDLHDELGSELSGIALATSMVGRREYLEERDRDRLLDVQTTATRVMQGLRDIVWYIKEQVAPQMHVDVDTGQERHRRHRAHSLGVARVEGRGAHHSRRGRQGLQRHLRGSLRLPAQALRPGENHQCSTGRPEGRRADQPVHRPAGAGHVLAPGAIPRAGRRLRPDGARTGDPAAPRRWAEDEAHRHRAQPLLPHHLQPPAQHLPQAPRPLPFLRGRQGAPRRPALSRRPSGSRSATG